MCGGGGGGGCGVCSRLEIASAQAHTDSIFSTFLPRKAIERLPVMAYSAFSPSLFPFSSSFLLRLHLHPLRETVHSFLPDTPLPKHCAVCFYWGREGMGNRGMKLFLFVAYCTFDIGVVVRWQFLRYYFCLSSASVTENRMFVVRVAIVEYVNTRDLQRFFFVKTQSKGNS